MGVYCIALQAQSECVTITTTSLNGILTNLYTCTSYNVSIFATNNIGTGIQYSIIQNLSKNLFK